MSNRKTTFFYGFLIALASLAAGMVLASRLDLTPASLARAVNIPETNSAPIDGPLDASTFRNIATAQNPLVVSIQTQRARRGRAATGGGGFFEEFFQNPRGRQQQPQQQLPPAVGGGSGFIIDKAGFILTNNHVVEDSTAIEVFLTGMRNTGPGSGLAAKLVGRDILTDSALIQLTEMPATALGEVKFGDSDQLGPGDWVMAIGSPFGFTNTVTVGVVSAVSRTDPQLQPVPQRDLEMIQTDAAINRGNSGGPLLNIRGEVIGINTAIISDTPGMGGNIGIGFAVPINTVKEILPSLRTGKVVRGRIGVQVSNLPVTAEDLKAQNLPSTGAALITTVTPGGPADDGGMLPSDWIVEFNGRPVADSDALINMVTRTAPGTNVPVKVVRGGKTVTLNIVIEELDLATELGQSTQTPEPEAEPDPTEPTDAGLGLSVEPLTPAVARQLELPTNQSGVLVAGVAVASPAQGLFAPGDVIVAVNGQPVSTVEQLKGGIAGARVGTLVILKVVRAGAEQAIPVRKR
jgi:serine protease Do